MRTIDCGGLGIALIVNEQGILQGTVTDGDIRKALREGMDINSSVTTIMNKDPIKIKEGYGAEEILLQLNKKERKFAPYYSLKVPIINAERKVINMAVYTIGEGTIRFLTQDTPQQQVKSILVVGGAGYLGSVLCRKLLQKGYTVRVLDMLLFGKEPIEELKLHSQFEYIHGDIRDITTISTALQDIDAVIHLAAIVGDPAGRDKPLSTIETNYLASMTLAQACRYHQINRFLFASTCSVYGQGNALLDETSPLNPVSLYARSKIESEKAILGLADGNFAPTILRMSTLHGLSPRMRFDLVVNIFALKSTMERKIKIFGGNQWRPLLHVDDAADAFIKCLEAPIEAVRGQVFNVGSSEQNFRILELGKIVQEVIPGTELEIEEENNSDQRDYRVSFAKIESTLGFKPRKTVQQSLLEIHTALQNNAFPDVTHPRYYNSG